MDSTLNWPGARLGDYPERRDRCNDLPGVWQKLRAALPTPALRWRLWQTAGHSWQHAAALQTCEPAQLQQQLAQAQHRVQREGLAGQAGQVACALVAEVARRVTGRQAYREQHMAALGLLRGCMVEMGTGEGKTLATALAAGVAALAGSPVHVFTANDYLVERDARQFQSFYQWLGLDVGWVLSGDDADRRRTAYRQPVTYVTARELAFDYLRDRLHHGTGQSELQRHSGLLLGRWGTPLLRGLCVGFIDEADSVLVDEAQMPLLLSQPADQAAQRAFVWQAHQLARQLQRDADFTLPGNGGRPVLTPQGQARSATLALTLGPMWQRPRHRQQALLTALMALHVLQRDADYVVVPQTDTHGRSVQVVQIVDRHTGRQAHGRQWQQGLHAQVALKEGCELPAHSRTAAQISFQHLFRRYHHLGGLSGTLAEARRELHLLYATPLVRVPLRLPSRAQQLPPQCWPDEATRRAAVVRRVAALSAQGRPVLVGCESVVASEALSQALQLAGLPHRVLNARQDAHEAAVVARAGHAGHITVATRMAGRGTDIKLDTPARSAGGLHVLSCQFNTSRRHDRQLIGRSARQGEPGSHEQWLVAQDPQLPALLRVALRLNLRCPAGLKQIVLLPLLRLTQWQQQRQLASARWRLFRLDMNQQQQLGFAGPRL